MAVIYVRVASIFDSIVSLFGLLGQAPSAKISFTECSQWFSRSIGPQIFDELKKALIQFFDLPVSLAQTEPSNPEFTS